ncbi:MAG: polymorphic toxin-type HINT domain-containing protein [Elusimicrobia bacterium]|nr:polymorphic toxin-type HINT domain-containing protein [Elusimicrobiota bacterium]
MQQQFVKTTVTATTQDQTDKYYVINTSAGSLKVTPAHQIFVNGKWTDSNDIKPGDTLIGEDGKPVTVTSVQTIMASIPVYDLITDDPHDFFADHILVHNVNPGATNKDHGIGAGTLIALADGSLVPVEQIKAGDKVMSYNWSKKAFGFSVVRSAEKQTVSQYRVINGKLKVGMKQPLFIAKKTNTPKSK